MSSRYKEGSLLALRLVLAAIFIYHGLPKLMNPSGMTSFFSSLGLPGFSIPIIGLLEVGAGILVIIGLWHTWATHILAVIIAGAVILVHIPNLGNGISTGFERDVLILISLLVLAASGPGQYAWAKKVMSHK